MNGASGYDTLLDLYGPDCQLVTSDDDGGSGLSARLTTTLPETGIYTIIARAMAVEPDLTTLFSVIAN